MKIQKIALVTGAAKRLGKAIAIGLAKDGWDVAIHYGNSQEAAQETVKEILATGQRGIALQADLSDEGQASDLIKR